MKFFGLMILLLTRMYNPLLAQNQYMDLDWVKAQGGVGPDFSISMAVDANGNVYTAGNFYGTVDFDPGPGVFNLTAPGTMIPNIYISKLDASGNFVWAKQMGGPFCLSNQGRLILDASGNIFITGEWVGGFDCDPGPGVFQLSSFPLGFGDIFICKLDPAGNFMWAKQISSFQQKDTPSLAIGSNGDVYVTGNFTGPTDFDPGPGVFNLAPFGSKDIFITRLSSTGDFIWAGQIGGSNFVVSTSIVLDGSGNIFCSGSFFGTVDLDPGPGIYNLTTFGLSDIFISKLDPSGNFLWAKQLGGTDNDNGKIKLDAAGNIYLTGYFSGTADFDPGPGVSSLVSFGGQDIFVSKLDLSGNFIFTRQMGGTGADYGTDVSTDAAGNIYVTGSFNASVDFDPGPGIYTLTAFGGQDIFVSKLDPSGNFICTKQMGGTGSDAGRALIPDNSGNIYITGYFSTTADFNPCLVAATLTSAGNSDIFTAKLNFKTPSITITSPTNSICAGDTVTFSAVAVNSGPSPVYQWKINGINTGTNSPVYTTNNLLNGDIVSVTMSYPCLIYAPVFSNTITMIVIPGGPAAISIAFFPAKICYGTTVTFIASPVNGGSNPSFQWRLNGTITGTNSSSYITSTLDSGDVVDCIMTSNAPCVSPLADTSQQIVIKIDPAVCPVGFYMPTAFTPNNDGRNDLCKPLLFGRVLLYRFALYNRWGQKIFETTDLQKGWDGRVLGTNQGTNIFIWTCTFQFKGQAVDSRHGTVILIH